MDIASQRADLLDRLEAEAATGTTLAVWAELQPGKPMVINPDGSSRTLAQVNANANRIVRRLTAPRSR